MRVIATAGHVDHGKSTLVRALTGTDPDRWAEEHRRGLTIDLGYAWTTLPGGEVVAFVDVPGHQRFIANMLAGLGPAPAVLLVVAADEGWRRQTTEHLAATQALGLTHGLVALTRSDLVDGSTVERRTAEIRERLRGTGLARAGVIPCSGATGDGLDALREGLARLCAELPEPDPTARVRLWIDRAFTVVGAGTVVTGTLSAGTLRVGDQVQLATADGAKRPPAIVRGLQSLGQDRDEVPAPARVAVNLRGVPADILGRGDLLLTPGAWHTTDAADVRLDRPAEELPEHLMVHLGTAALPARLRPLSERTARLRWQRAVPLQVGDRMVLRDPGRQTVTGGAVVLDADPPELRRRGAGRQRGQALETASAGLDPLAEIERRGWVGRDTLMSLGAAEDELDRLLASGAARRATPDGELIASAAQWSAWVTALADHVHAAVDADPLQARTPVRAAAGAVGLPDPRAVTLLAPAAGLEVVAGHVQLPGRGPSLGPAEAGLQEVERRLAENPFAAPERPDLDALGLGPRQVAVAVRLGRLVELGEGVLVAPRSAALAMRELSALPQPFTTSEARQALGTTRRVVIPLLEELDRRGWTRRIDAGHREVARGGGS